MRLRIYWLSSDVIDSLALLAVPACKPEWQASRRFQCLSLLTRVNAQKQHWWELAFSNKQLKSTCTIPPVIVSSNIFSICLSPSLSHFMSNWWMKGWVYTYPKMNPTMDITAAERLYVNLLVSHALGSGNVSMNHSWKRGENLYSVSGAFIHHRKDKQRQNFRREYYTGLFIARFLDSSIYLAHLARLQSEWGPDCKTTVTKPTQLFIRRAS